MADIDLQLSRRQYADLVKMLEMAHEMVASLDENYRTYEMLHRRVDELTNTVFAAGLKSGEEAILEVEGEPAVSDAIAEYVEKVMDDYEEDIFWNELKRRLAERDFATSLTQTERRMIMRGEGKLPERAKKIYNDYDAEFEKHGVSRLKISAN